MPELTNAAGAVGELADVCFLQAKNGSVETMRAIVRVTAPNLCRSHAAYASLVVDGEPAASKIDLNDGRMYPTAEVPAGGTAVLVVQLVDLHNHIMCIRLGEIEFELDFTEP